MDDPRTDTTLNLSFDYIHKGVFDYVLRDMTHPQGGFYSAEDADSAPDSANPDEKTEGAFYIWTKAEVVSLLGKEAREKLFKYRAKRLRPHLDDKILTDWNGLMISSLAFGSRVLEEPRPFPYPPFTNGF